MPCKAFNAYQRLPITHDAKRPRGGHRVWLPQGGQPLIFSIIIFGNGLSADMISTPPSLVWLGLHCWGTCFKPLGDARHLRASVGLFPPAQH